MGKTCCSHQGGSRRFLRIRTRKIVGRLSRLQHWRCSQKLKIWTFVNWYGGKNYNYKLPASTAITMNPKTFIVEMQPNKINRQQTNCTDKLLAFIPFECISVNFQSGNKDIRDEALIFCRSLFWITIHEINPIFTSYFTARELQSCHIFGVIFGTKFVSPFHLF